MAANGEPLLCAIIFAAKTMKHEWITGFDPLAEWLGNEEDNKINSGDGKTYPYGPVCVFKRKEVPFFCCNSESGSITGELLTAMLKYIDDLQVFDRTTTGLNPFLLLDGHGSQFELDFLEYINREETKWVVNIGLPHGTSYWQVGDSMEQNGCFKMVLAREKQALVTKKSEHALPFEINKTDVVKLVKDAWNVSFARVETNRKAVLHRGWGPKALNMNVLKHKEIMGTMPSAMTKSNSTSQGGSRNILPSQLNITEGLAGTLICTFVLESTKHAASRASNIAEITKK